MMWIAALQHPRLRPYLLGALLVVLAAALYLPQLGDAPFYLNRDEMFFGLTAHSLSLSGHDPNGLFLPLYTQSPMRYGSGMWFQPMLMYSAALSVKVFGLSEAAIRLPMALAGIADVLLVYLIGRLLFRREVLAVAAGVLLAITPAHYIHGRVAMDFQAPLPFLLAGLLCTLLYLERHKPAWLFAAGLSLGVGLYTYIAAYMWMPTYAALTLAVLWQRRERWTRHGLLVAGLAIPALCCVPFLLTHPTVIRDVMWHYDREQPQAVGGMTLLSTYFNYSRFADAAAVYARFWSPRFLFIDGPHALWAAGTFLVATTGLLLVGFATLLRRLTPKSILLIGGLLTAPIPASLVGDGDAIHRASAVLPFAVLIAITGLEYLWTATGERRRVVAFVAMWATIIIAATTYHGSFAIAQAVVRAATVPLAIAGLSALWLIWRETTAAPPRLRDLAAPAVVALAAMQAAYLVVGYSSAAWGSGLLVATVMLSALTGISALSARSRQRLVVVALAVACSHFMFAHADYSTIRRVAFIPATAILLAVRFAYAAVALAMAGWLASRLAHSRVERFRGTVGTVVLVVVIVALQTAYFHVDYFDDQRWRLPHTLLILAAAVVAAALSLGNTIATPRLATLAAAAMLGIAALQSAYFEVDFFTRYRAHSGHFDTEGNSRIVWEAALARANERAVPAFYLAAVGPYGFADLYWQFYTTKHNRTDLLSLSTAESTFDPERVRHLPDTSLVVTSPSPVTDAAIDQLMAAGNLRSKALLTAPDGRSQFWLLETRRGG